MSYTIRPDVTLKPLAFTRQRPVSQIWDSFNYEPSAVFELDNGDLIAMHYSAKRITETNMLSCLAVAWLVDADGDAQGVDGDGDGPDEQQAIFVEFRHNAPPYEIEALTTPGIAAALRDLVLGVPATDPPAIAWSDELRQQTSIRSAITTARAVGEIFDLATVTVTPVPPLVVE